MELTKEDVVTLYQTCGMYVNGELVNQCKYWEICKMTQGWCQLKESK